MPDWRKSSDYTFTRRLTDQRWAWEFLRRNREYRASWAAMLDRLAARSDEFEEFPKIVIRDESGHVSETAVRITDPQDPNFYAPIPEKEQWFLARGLLNPATDDPGALAFSVGWGEVAYFQWDLAHKLYPSGLRYPWAAFDIRLPLKPQIEAILTTLRREQARLGITARRPKFHRTLWPHYLRLLDADIDDRAPAKIADVLCGESDMFGLDARKVWEQLRAAKRMTEPEGYLAIFLARSGRSESSKSK